MSVPQFDVADLVAKILAAEAAVPGYIDAAIAALTTAENNLFGNWILTHIGITDPKGAEDHIIGALKAVKAILAQGVNFAKPFLDMLLSLKVIKPAATLAQGQSVAPGLVEVGPGTGLAVA